MKTIPEKDKAIGMYKLMYTIRMYEERIYYLFLEGIMPGSIHQSTGQEAAAVGMLYDLTNDDFMLSTHRPAGHDIAKGMTIRSMMCEMFGKQEGCCAGKGGAMHMADMSKGILPANAIVGGNLPIGAGIALSCKMQKKDSVTVCFFGDGASNEGAFHESMNVASLWKLPVIYVCENNLYSANTSIKLTCPIEDVAAGRASAYALPSEVVDGNDVIAVNEAAARAIQRARSGEGATIIELKTYRHVGHSRNDACSYQPKEERQAWVDKDPVKTFRKKILDQKLIKENELEEIEAQITQMIDAEVEYAQNAPFPDVKSALADVYWGGGRN